MAWCDLGGPIGWDQSLAAPSAVLPGAQLTLFAQRILAVKVRNLQTLPRATGAFYCLKHPARQLITVWIVLWWLGPLKTVAGGLWQA